MSDQNESAKPEQTTTPLNQPYNDSALSGTHTVGLGIDKAGNLPPGYALEESLHRNADTAPGQPVYPYPPVQPPDPAINVQPHAHLVYSINELTTLVTYAERLLMRVTLMSDEYDKEVNNILSDQPLLSDTLPIASVIRQAPEMINSNKSRVMQLIAEVEAALFS